MNIALSTRQSLARLFPASVTNTLIVRRAWIGHGSDEMVKLYTHLHAEYRKKILNTIPTIIQAEFHPVHPEFETEISEQVA